jgi:hypothetical protein
MSLPKKKCLICKKPSISRCCSLACAIRQSVLDREKRDRRNTKLQLDKLKTLREYLKEAEKECNEYIRIRDKALPCISCGRYHNGQWHAGHYRSVGAASQLRFNEDNIHKQCAPCNNHKSGNTIEYRINLVKKIGVDRVENLERNNTIVKYTIDDAKRIKQEYKEKRKSLQSM